MYKKIKIKYLIAFLFIMIVLLLIVYFNLFPTNVKNLYAKRFNKIEERYTELLKRPLPKTREEFNKRISDSEKLKNDENILITQAKEEEVFDDVLDTKEELLEKIDSKISVLSDMLLSAFDISITAQKDELQRAKTHIIELKEFRKKAENTTDDEKIKILIKEYELTLMYKKIRLD